MGTEGVERDYIRNEILPEFFRNFWVAQNGPGQEELPAAGRDDCRTGEQGGKPC